VYISKININNFRNFSNSTFEFSEGTNVIIGHNNAGKTNLIKAIQLVLDSRKSKSKLTVDDFCKQYSDFSTPPEITISITLSEQTDEPADDKVVVYDWITGFNPKYEAQLTFSFFLPQGDDYDDYCKQIDNFKIDGKYESEKAWRFIKKYFFSKYVVRVYGGDIDKKESADYEMLQKFDFQFLDAIRDAEKQMFFGNNTILKEVLNYFLDFDITDGKKLKDLPTEMKDKLRDKENAFEGDSNNLFNQLKTRISKNEILKYAKETGASKGGIPDLDAHLNEDDLLFALRLIIEIDGMKIPISNNGLGYNNLLYTALVLAKMQIESQSSYYGENAKVFPILAIEEPEAHLHPSMQFKFLKFLSKNINLKGKVRQLFVTTHSTHITSAAELDDVICLYKGLNGKTNVGYPGKAFGKDEDSKNYVKRFLNATKSNMLFADKVILVEGLAEQLLLPCLAAYECFDAKNNITNEDELINQHVCIVSVDSRTFSHFLRLFSYDENNKNAIKKVVVCITDADPEFKGNDNKWRSCFPFELEDSDKFNALASHVKSLKSDFEEPYRNISIFHPEEKKGKTLEHEFIRYNPGSELVITKSFPSQNSPHTIEKFKALQKVFNENNEDYLGIISAYEKTLTTNKQKEKFEKLKNGIKVCGFSDKDKSIAVLSAIYYNIVKSLKGEHALYLEESLRKDLEKSDPEFVIPTYVNNALKKILG
jgi:putative ATP-dependent endonuclease of OLD family